MADWRQCSGHGNSDWPVDGCQDFGKDINGTRSRSSDQYEWPKLLLSLATMNVLRHMIVSTVEQAKSTSSWHDSWG